MKDCIYKVMEAEEFWDSAIRENSAAFANCINNRDSAKICGKSTLCPKNAKNERFLSSWPNPSFPFSGN